MSREVGIRRIRPHVPEPGDLECPVESRVPYWAASVDQALHVAARCVTLAPYCGGSLDHPAASDCLPGLTVHSPSLGLLVLSCPVPSPVTSHCSSRRQPSASACAAVVHDSFALAGPP